MWNYSSLFLCREVPIDIKSLSELALIMEFILVYRSELEWTKRADLPFKPCCSAVGHVGCRLCSLALWRLVEFRLWPADLLKSSTFCLPDFNEVGDNMLANFSGNACLRACKKKIQRCNCFLKMQGWGECKEKELLKQKNCVGAKQFSCSCSRI